MNEAMQKELGVVRDQIDSIDAQLLELLNRRARCAEHVGEIKSRYGEAGHVYRPEREAQVLRRIQSLNQGPLPNESVTFFFREVMSACLSLENPLGIAFLGPLGTFSESAAVKHFGHAARLAPQAAIDDVFREVEAGHAQYGVVPVENSTEGAIFHSLDMLAGSDLKVIAQVYLEIEHCLLSHSPLAEIRTVISKDIALAQCRQWLNRNLPGVEWSHASSTTAAVKEAASTPGVAAVAGKVASALYGIPVVAEGIQDLKDNVTRFLVIGRQCSAPLGGGRDKTSLLVSLNDRPGALMHLLEPFARRGINLCKIESRPSRRKAWDYYFFIDSIGHRDEPAVREVLAELEASCPYVKWLGSYPA